MTQLLLAVAISKIEMHTETGDGVDLPSKKTAKTPKQIKKKEKKRKKALGSSRKSRLLPSTF